MHHVKFASLLVTSILITACTNSHNSTKQGLLIDESGDAPAEMIAKVKKKVESPAFTYLLDTPTAKIRYGIVGSSMISYSGTLSREAKDLVREVWTNLERKGFSGYDPTQLNQENIPFSDGGWYSSPTGPGVNKGNEKIFHTHLIRRLNDMEVSFVGSPHYDGYISTLFGMQINGKYLVPVYISSEKTIEKKDVKFVLSNEIRKDNKEGLWNYPFIDPSDTVITKEQRAEWDQIFIDAIKKHPALADNLDERFLTPSDSSDILGETGTLTNASMRHHQTGGSVHAPEFLSQDIKINAPMHIKMVGNPLEESSPFVGSVFLKTNNTLLGFSGASLNNRKKHTQLDTNLTSTVMIGQGFFELQGGSISTTSYKAEARWNGYRQAYVLGYDFANGLTPFAQVVFRSLETDNSLQENQTSAYLGISSEKETSNPLFTNKLNATAKIGGKVNTLSNNFRKTQNGAFDYSVNIEHTFKAESIDFSLSMGIASKQTDNLKFSIIFEQ